MKSILAMVISLLVLNFSSPVAQAAELDTIFVPYGFLTGSYWAADHSVASVGAFNSNFSAPVASGLDRGSSDHLGSRSRGSFEVQQSRFGFSILPKSLVHGKLEFDFFNGANASPSTASLLRLRIAKIEWQINESTLVFIGQDWDLFNAGVNPYTHNWVGNGFQGGNVGFMRQQLALLKRVDDIEYAGALGMAQNSSTNTGAFGSSNSDSDFSIPTLAARVSVNDGKNKWGVAGLYAPRISATTIAGTDSSNSHAGFGVDAFLDRAISDFTVRGKIYWGQNLRDLGALTLASIVPGSGASMAHSTHEWGGFVSVARLLSEHWNIFGGGGIAKVLEEAVLPTDALMRNWQLKLGADYLIPETKAKVFLELTRYSTQYKLASAPTQFVANVGQLGIEMAF